MIGGRDFAQRGIGRSALAGPCRARRTEDDRRIGRRSWPWPARGLRHYADTGRRTPSNMRRFLRPFLPACLPACRVTGPATMFAAMPSIFTTMPRVLTILLALSLAAGPGARAVLDAVRFPADEASAEASAAGPRPAQAGTRDHRADDPSGAGPARTLQPRSAAPVRNSRRSAFLRGICGSKEGLKWRNEAEALIDAEAPSGERHELMVAKLQSRLLRVSRRATGPARRPPRWLIRRYLQEGARIARDITARYANLTQNPLWRRLL